MQSTTIKKFISSLLFGIQIFNLYSIYRYVYVTHVPLQRYRQKVIFLRTKKKRKKKTMCFIIKSSRKALVMNDNQKKKRKRNDEVTAEQENNHS